MPDTVLIEVATSLPEWMFSWWHFAILGVMVAGSLIVSWLIFGGGGHRADHIGSSACLVIASVFFWGMISGAIGSNRVIPYEEAERAADEISEVTGVPVTAEQVQGMEDGVYVPGVNYDRLTDSGGDLVFKVEIKK